MIFGSGLSPSFYDNSPIYSPQPFPMDSPFDSPPSTFDDSPSFPEQDLRSQDSPFDSPPSTFDDSPSFPEQDLRSLDDFG